MALDVAPELLVGRGGDEVQVHRRRTVLCVAEHDLLLHQLDGRRGSGAPDLSLQVHDGDGDAGGGGDRGAQSERDAQMRAAGDLHPIGTCRLHEPGQVTEERGDVLPGLGRGTLVPGSGERVRTASGAFGVPRAGRRVWTSSRN